MSELDSLIRMANQIAANFQFQEDGMKRTAAHLKRFWAPALRKQLTDYAATDGKGIDEAVFGAIRLLEAADKTPAA